MSGGGADSDSIYKEIDAEDVGAMTKCGGLAAIDSAPTSNATSPNATSLMQLWNQLTPKNFVHFLIFMNQHIYFPTGKYSMYRSNKEFDKFVKECTWILCQNC